MSVIGLLTIIARSVGLDYSKANSVMSSAKELSSLEKYRHNSVINLGISSSTGFLCTVEVDSIVIEPNLNHKPEFRTSQLVSLNGKKWPSRKVLYKSVHKVIPSVVVVLPLNANERVEKLREAVNERKQYCKQHNYGLFVRYIQDFAAEGKPAKESIGLAPIRMLRQAMNAFPESKWFWLYDSNGRINHLDSEILVLDKSKVGEAIQISLDETMNSAPIEHFATRAEDASIFLSYDTNQKCLTTKSVYLNRSITSLAVLELLTFPLLQDWKPFYESSNHADMALTHVSRWHPQLVSSIALLPPRSSGSQMCSEATSGEDPCILH